MFEQCLPRKLTLVQNWKTFIKEKSSVDSLSGKPIYEKGYFNYERKPQELEAYKITNHLSTNRKLVMKKSHTHRWKRIGNTQNDITKLVVVNWQRLLLPVVSWSKSSLIIFCKRIVSVTTILSLYTWDLASLGHNEVERITLFLQCLTM